MVRLGLHGRRTRCGSMSRSSGPAGLGAREIRLDAHRPPPGSAENGQSRPRDSLIPSLIHLRTPASIGVHHSSLSRQGDLRGQSCMVILNPEKRKAGGSTPPLTTTSDLRQRALSGRKSATRDASSLIFGHMSQSGTIAFPRRTAGHRLACRGQPSRDQRRLR